jgi:hypothetical protein
VANRPRSDMGTEYIVLRSRQDLPHMQHVQSTHKDPTFPGSGDRAADAVWFRGVDLGKDWVVLTVKARAFPIPLVLCPASCNKMPQKDHS